MAPKDATETETESPATPVKAQTNGRRMLSADEILSAEDIQYEDVEIKEWGGWVRVKSLTGEERDRYEANIVKQGKRGENRIDFVGARAKLVAMAVVDANGQRMFRQAHVEALSKKNGAALDRLWDVAARLCGMTDERLEELVGDLGIDPKDAITSAGP